MMFAAVLAAFGLTGGKVSFIEHGVLTHPGDRGTSKSALRTRQAPPRHAPCPGSSSATCRRALGDPGAAVPVALEPAREASSFDMQLSRKPGEPTREIELEPIAGGHAPEFPSRRRRAGREEPDDAAAAAVPLQPHVEAAAALVDQVGGGIGDQYAHRCG